MNELAAPLLGDLARGLLDSSVLVVLALVAERTVLRGRRAVVRSTLWLAVLARLALPWGWLAEQLPVGTWSAGWGAVAQQASEGVASAASSAPGGGALLLITWLAVAALLIARGGWVLQRTSRRWRRASAPAPSATRREASRIAKRLGLRRTPEVRVASGLASAFVIGVRRPLVVLPRDAPRAERRAALWHELAHVRRHDLLAQAAFAIVHALWWPHPLLGLARRRAAAAREVACDATVTRALGVRASRYRQALGQVARRALAGSQPLAGAAAWRQPASLVERLDVLLRRPLRAPRLARAAAAVPTLLVTLGLAATVASAPWPAWWDDARAARAEAATWTTRQPGRGCTPGRLVALRSLVLHAAPEGARGAESPAHPEGETSRGRRSTAC
ncbi:MAG: M56 family metallopeptidase [Planctomycetota bacterium]